MHLIYSPSVTVPVASTAYPFSFLHSLPLPIPPFSEIWGNSTSLSNLTAVWYLQCFILPFSHWHSHIRDLSWPICCICCWAAASFTYVAVYSRLPLSANYYLPVPAPLADKTHTEFTFPMSSALAAVSCSSAYHFAAYFLCVSRRLPGFPASVPSVQRINTTHVKKTNLFEHLTG